MWREQEKVFKQNRKLQLFRKIKVEQQSFVQQPNVIIAKFYPAGKYHKRKKCNNDDCKIVSLQVSFFSERFQKIKTKTIISNCAQRKNPVV